MKKDEYADLLAEIGGGREIGIAARRERDMAEQTVLAKHEEEFWGLLCIGDAVHQFYRDSLEQVRAGLLNATIDEVHMAMVNWHIVSFGRFAAAFDLMAHGYYFETMVLARDLWEVALSLAGLKKNVVTLEELLAAKATTRREAEEWSRDADRKIRNVLISENAALSQAARDAVETFLGIANLATHKSKLHLGLNLHDLVRSREAIPIFPRFDLERAGAAHNVLYLATWSILSTLPYLEFDLLTNAGWNSLYSKVQLAFHEGPARGPNAVVQAWPEIIQQVFAT